MKRLFWQFCVDLGLDYNLSLTPVFIYDTSMKKIFFILLLSLNFTACTTTTSTPTAVTPTTITDEKKTLYLSSNLYSEIKQQISDFPTTGSPAQIADENKLRQAQKSRTAEDCARANTEVKITLQSLYGKPFGELNEKQVSVLGPFFEQIRNDAGFYIGQLKKGYNRQRPYLYLTDLKPCVPLENSFAYPSGHSTLAKLYSLVLTDLLPQLKNKLNRRSDQIAQDRVLGGVHHPTDISAGKKSGEILYAEIKKSPLYQDDVQRYKKLLTGL